mmetsp:Transcript_13397/g.18475  ORF Transcript_13397/g.18475 Transcript_13397/m.18475 type:complete len:82 (+) Transcript_13397:1030-1275(+)
MKPSRESMRWKSGHNNQADQASPLKQPLPIVPLVNTVPSLHQSSALYFALVSHPIFEMTSFICVSSESWSTSALQLPIPDV